MSTPNKIAYAIYGVGQRNNGNYSCMHVPHRTVEVTSIVASVWAAAPNNTGSLLISNNAFSNDPAPGEIKYFTVFYTDGTPADCVEEGSLWLFNPFINTQPTYPCYEPEGIFQCWWGLPSGLNGTPPFVSKVNVTAVVREHSKYSLSLRPTQEFFSNRGVADPAAGHAKVLLVYWHSCLSFGKGCSGPIFEGDWFAFPPELFLAWPT